jgi:hypothetical protein
VQRVLSLFDAEANESRRRIRELVMRDPRSEDAPPAASTDPLADLVRAVCGDLVVSHNHDPGCFSRT